MELVFERIQVPQKHSFIARKLALKLRSPRIHSHKNYELNLITAGCGRRLVGDHIAPFEEGDLVLMGPNLPHCWDVDFCKDDKSPTGIVIHFYEDIIGSDFFNIPELNCVENLLKESARGIYFSGIDRQLIAMKMEAITQAKGLESYIHLLQVFELLLNCEKREYLAVTPHSRSFKKDLDRINEVYQYVLENIQGHISQEEAAAILHMAPGSFCRYFRKKTNTTFSSYVKKVRIALASRMLIETDQRISQICYDCGYNSIANFNHHFKTLTGKSPSEYRKTFEM